MNNSLLTSQHQKKLLKKWGAILESGTPIENETTKIALAQILENTRNYYRGTVTEGIDHSDGGPIGKSQVMTGGGVMNGGFNQPYAGTDNYGDFYLPNVVLPMLRRIMPDLMANELVAVQPLNGPVGYALAYRPTYGQFGQFDSALTANDGREIGYNPVDPRFTGISSNNALPGHSELTVDTASTYWQAYGGSTGMWLGGAANTKDVEWATLGTNYPTVTFGLVKSAVEAKTRKLAAHWTPELAEDMQVMHGIDVEREMVNTLTYEVGAEIDRQIITEMVKAAIIGGSTTDWTPISADGLDQMGRLATLLTQITIEANQIAIRTKRGNANFVVTTPRVCALLQQLSMNKFSSFKNNVSMPSVPDTGVGALAKVGLINDDSQLLIRDSYVQSNTEDYLLMGYKGKQAGDSGIIYCPYIPLQLSRVLQPGSFTPSIGARTRYGVMANPWDARNYYSFMKIKLYSADGYSWDTGRHFIAEPSKLVPPFTGAQGGNPVIG